jgi:hypothetical protein
MASHKSREEMTSDEMLAAVLPNLTRSDIWSQLMTNVLDVATADHKSYKQGAFSSLIQSSDSPAQILLVYLESPLVSQAEKKVFLDAIETFVECCLEYYMDKPIGDIADRIMKDFAEPLIDVFRADMLASSGVYVPRSLIARRMYSIDLYNGIISPKDCK